MRINVWISYNGLTTTPYDNLEYPYKALSPLRGVEHTYTSDSSIDDEILALYNEAINRGGQVGEAIYMQSMFITSPLKLIDDDMQNTIKRYSFCKTFNCPPFPSLQETPADTIDDFMIIEEEYNHCLAKEKNNVHK